MARSEGLGEFDADTSQYELIRARHASSAWAPITRKIRWLGYLLIALAGIVPVVLFLPTGITETYFSGSPIASPLWINSVAVVTIITLLVAAAGLVWVARRKFQIADISSSQAWILIGYEDLFSAMGFITGGVGVLVTLGLAAVGYLGIDQYEELMALGLHPYYPGETLQFSVLTVATVSLVAATLAFAMSIYARRYDA